ncbi:MAG: hypothetical protein H0T14_06205 [Nocardioidaceae bacterium]|nr:hypothetical protein [Nocardioidaceae bacterium]
MTPVGGLLLKKLLSVIVVGAVAKVVRDKMASRSDNEAALWAEATAPVTPAH